MPSRYMPSMRPTPSRSVAVLALYILLWTASPSVQLPTRQIAPREVADAEPQVNVVPPPIAPPPSTRCKAEADTPPDDTTDVGPRQSKRAFDPLPDESTPNSCGHLQDNLCGLGARCLMDADCWSFACSPAGLCVPTRSVSPSPSPASQMPPPVMFDPNYKTTVTQTMAMATATATVRGGRGQTTLAAATTTLKPTPKPTPIVQPQPQPQRPISGVPVQGDVPSQDTPKIVKKKGGNDQETTGDVRQPTLWSGFWRSLVKMVGQPDMDAEDATIDLSGPFTASRVTYYGDGFQKMFDPPPIGPENGGWYGACYNVFYQNPAIIPKNFNKFAALNERQYNQVGPKTVCGTCVQLTMPRTNRTTIVQIVDMCPGCSSDYGLDISHAAMADLVGGGSDATNTDAWKNAERVGALAAVRWEAVPCSMLAESAVFDGPAGYLSPTATATSGQDRGSVRGSGSGSGSGAPAPVASSAGTPTSPGGDLTNAGPWMKPQFHFSPEPVP